MTSELTVVIPLYNKEHYIQRALESVLSQHQQVDEIIVVDDGSTDNSAQKVKDLNNAKIKLIQQTNSGVSVARNTGIKNTKSKYVAFLDADDIWQSNFTENIFTLIRNYPKAGMFATAYSFLSNGKRTPAKLKGVPSKFGLLNDYYASCLKADLPITASSVVIEKAQLEAIGCFPVGMKMGEDQLTWSRIANISEIAFANVICVDYDVQVADSACQVNLITELAPHVIIWKEELNAEKIPTKFIHSLEQLIHLSALYCVKNNLKIGKNRTARTLLFSEPYLSKDKYWFAALLLTFVPHFILKRIF